MDNNTNENSDNSEFVRLVAIHDRTIRGYVRSLLPQSEYVDDVMQEVLVIAWKKFSDLRDSKDFDRWACTIAKYQVLNFRRRMARDKLVMSDDVVRMLAEEGIEDQDDRKMQLGFLEECIARLPVERQNLIRQAYQPGIRLSKVANELGKKENAVYQLLWRIRQNLSSCVTQKMTSAQTS